MRAGGAEARRRAGPGLAGVVVLAALAGATTIGPPARGEDAVDRAEQGYAEAVGRAEREAATKLDKALRAYDRALEEALRAATRAGDLREVERISAARAAVAAKLGEMAGGERDPDAAPGADRGFGSAKARSARERFVDQEDAALAAQADRVQAARRTLAKALVEAVKAVTRTGDLEAANKVDARRAAVDHALAMDAALGRGEWVTLFRSDDPTIWNTATRDGADRFAVPLEDAPFGIRYLRLRRVDTDAAVIVRLRRDQLGALSTRTGRHAWDGRRRRSWGGTHLGIDSAEWPLRVQHGGRIMVIDDRSNAGWGFGHVVHANDRQGFTWAGEEIERTVFEIAAKGGGLAEADRAQLLEEGR